MENETKLSIENVEELAELQKLRLSKEEAEEILKYIEHKEEEFKFLESVDTENVLPLYSPLQEKIITRYINQEENKEDSDSLDINKQDASKMLETYYRI